MWSDHCRRLLARQGVDARVIIPGYGFIDHLQYKVEPLLNFEFHHRMGANPVDLFCCQHDGITFYMLQSSPYFGLEGDVYSNWTWDLERFVYFNQALMACLSQMYEERHWFSRCRACQ